LDAGSIAGASHRDYGSSCRGGATPASMNLRGNR
jgi:hypothetical protein